MDNLLLLLFDFYFETKTGLENKILTVFAKTKYFKLSSCVGSGRLRHNLNKRKNTVSLLEGGHRDIWGACGQVDSIYQATRRVPLRYYHKSAFRVRVS